MHARACLAALLALAAPCLAAPAQQGGGTAAQPDVLYHNYCSVCHGDRGDGKSRASNSLVPPPYDFTSARAKQELTRERIVAMVTAGKPGTAMVGWSTQLNAREIGALADYVVATFVQGRPAGAPAGAISGTHAHGGREADARPQRVDASLGYPRGLRGDAARGRPFYDANCATCHGKGGDGKGPRAYFINPKPRNFLDPAARAAFNRPVLYAAIASGRLGTEMPAWSKVIGDQQIADVAEYVYVAFVAPGAKGR